jgi:hypothetical protein
MIGIEIEAEGLEVVNELIEFTRSFLDAAGNLVTGCGLHVKPRLTTANNVVIANELIARSRDFFSLNDWEAGEVAAMFAKVVQSQMDTIAKKQIRAAGKGLKGIEKVAAMTKASAAGPGLDAQRATQVAGKAYKEAMAKWMHIVSDRIDKQQTVYGGSPAPLTDEYARQKMHDFGFSSPIGVRTGLLRENFDPSNVGNIRLYKDKTTMEKFTKAIGELTR